MEKDNPKSILEPSVRDLRITPVRSKSSLKYEVSMRRIATMNSDSSITRLEIITTDP